METQHSEVSSSRQLSMAAFQLPTATGTAYPARNVAISVQGEQDIDFSSGHVPYRNDPAAGLDVEALRRLEPAWGIDLDLARRPGVPREHSPAPDRGAHWDLPERQLSKADIQVSIERPGVTPVFGTTCPPRGLSGKIRRFAYRLSEDRALHWLSLIFADRIDVLETMFVGPSRS